VCSLRVSVPVQIIHHIIYHRRAVAQPCVNGDWLSKGRMAKFDPAHIRNPSTDRHKIRNRWLRRRDDPHAKFGANPSVGGFSANGWNITKIFLWYIYLFLLTDLPTHKKVILFNSTLTDRRCDGEWYHLFMIFAVSMCQSLHIAVNKCINWCFVHLS